MKLKKILFISRKQKISLKRTYLKIQKKAMDQNIKKTYCLQCMKNMEKKRTIKAGVEP